MYFWIVRLATEIPSFLSSPLILSAPHSEFSAAIFLIRSIVCWLILGLRFLGVRFVFPKELKPSPVPFKEGIRLHNQQSLPPGLTRLAKKTKNSRSRG